MGEPSCSQITVDVFSDFACPWCYVGKKQLEQAVPLFEDAQRDKCIQIRWHPYMIDPATAKNGEEYKAYNIRRWGGDGWTSSLRRAGRAVGCGFRDWDTWPNTLLAHSLMLSAAEKGKDVELARLLFKACYEEGKNISETATLVQLANSVGLDDSFLADTQQLEVVKGDRAAKSTMNIHGVPYFVINGKVTLEGAQDKRAFLTVFYKLV